MKEYIENPKVLASLGAEYPKKPWEAPQLIALSLVKTSGGNFMLQIEQLIGTNFFCGNPGSGCS